MIDLSDYPLLEAELERVDRVYYSPRMERFNMRQSAIRVGQAIDVFLLDHDELEVWRRWEAQLKWKRMAILEENEVAAASLPGENGTHE